MHRGRCRKQKDAAEPVQIRKRPRTLRQPEVCTPQRMIVSPRTCVRLSVGVRSRPLLVNFADKPICLAADKIWFRAREFERRPSDRTPDVPTPSQSRLLHHSYVLRPKKPVDHPCPRVPTKDPPVPRNPSRFPIKSHRPRWYRIASSSVGFRSSLRDSKRSLPGPPRDSRR